MYLFRLNNLRVIAMDMSRKVSELYSHLEYVNLNFDKIYNESYMGYNLKYKDRFTLIINIIIPFKYFKFKNSSYRIAYYKIKNYYIYNYFDLGYININIELQKTISIFYNNNLILRNFLLQTTPVIPLGFPNKYIDLSNYIYEYEINTLMIILCSTRKLHYKNRLPYEIYNLIYNEYIKIS